MGRELEVVRLSGEEYDKLLAENCLLRTDNERLFKMCQDATAVVELQREERLRLVAQVEALVNWNGKLVEENISLMREVDTIPSIVDHAVAVEREQCALTCEEIWSEEEDKFATGVAAECAAAIRRRGESNAI